MTITRRDLLIGGGISAGLGLFSGGIQAAENRPTKAKPVLNTDKKTSAVTGDFWDDIRAQFDIDQSFIQMSGFLLASHPRPVREAIEHHRKALDNNTVHHVERHWAFEEKNLATDGEQIVLESAARYLQTSPAQIALTDSTTAGLGLIYGGLKILPGQEILSTEHDHYATQESLRLRERRTGISNRKIRLYENAFDFDAVAAVRKLINEIRPNTRVLAITWVHSISGVKFPVASLANELLAINATRTPESRVLLCVDGVHGLGIENMRVEEMGCDFFIAGTHKWLFGPRGTGIVWGKNDAWQHVDPLIPSFSTKAITTPGRLFTSGGFHSFEHRWALNAAFDFHMSIGKQRVQERIHHFATKLKMGLQTIPKLQLVTPMASEFSSGFVCFQIQGIDPKLVVQRLEQEHRILASTTPTRINPDARFAAGLMNNDKDVEHCLTAVASMAQKA